MKELGDALKKLVEIYAYFNHLDNTYHSHKEVITDPEKQQIEASLIALFSQFMAQDGFNPKKIDKHRRSLSLLFHPDRLNKASEEIKWLEKILSDNKPQRGACFQLIELCEGEIINPTLPEKNFANINDIQALISRFKENREVANTFTQRALIDSILRLLENIDNFNHTTDKMGKWVQKFMNSMPYLSSGFCIRLYLKELSLLYALTFSCTKGGKWLEGSSSSIVRAIGREMRAYSLALSNASTTLIGYFVNINIIACDKVYYLGIEACSTIYKAIKPIPYFPNPLEDSNSTALILAPQHTFSGKSFKTLELKLIAIHLEHYQNYQRKQYLAKWREGRIKNTFMEHTYRQLIEIDDKDINLDDKIKEAEALIEDLARNIRVNVKGSYAGQVIQMMREVCHTLLPKNDEAKDESRLLAYDGQSMF